MGSTRELLWLCEVLDFDGDVGDQGLVASRLCIAVADSADGLDRLFVELVEERFKIVSKKRDDPLGECQRDRAGIVSRVVCAGGHVVVVEKHLLPVRLHETHRAHRADSIIVSDGLAGITFGSASVETISDAHVDPVYVCALAVTVRKRYATLRLVCAVLWPQDQSRFGGRDGCLHGTKGQLYRR